MSSSISDWEALLIASVPILVTLWLLLHDWSIDRFGYLRTIGAKVAFYGVIAGTLYFTH